MKKVVFLIMSILLLSPMIGESVSGAGSQSDVNIALGKQYKIESGAANEFSYGQTEQGTKDQLTDGLLGDPSKHYGGEWSHFVRGISRTITIDLEKTMAIKSFETAFIQNAKLGIYCPQEVVFSISEDGENFMNVSTIQNNVDNTVDTPTRVVYKAKADKSYKARFISIYFDVQVNSFMDEILVYGSENVSGASEIIPDNPINDEFYYDNGKNIGVKDIVCFHYGYWPNDETLANNKKDVFKSYIAYTDRDGNYVDTMFDAVMFLIIQGNSPSGGKLSVNGGPTIMSDWEYLIDNTFGEDINLNALDQATADMKVALKLPENHKTAVYLSVPHPKVSDIIFGDYDNDGVDNKILNLEDCVSVYSWYVDEVLKRYIEMDYKNIELKGFFWSNESLCSEYYEQEAELAKLCVKALHERGMQCIFIPFYQATGVEKAREVGFDSTIRQANLSFNKPLQQNPPKMMEDFAYTAGKYHTGIQMEIHHSFMYNIAEYAPLYKQYLVSAASSGLMNDSVHAYYQGAGYGSFYKCAYSKDPFVRWFYDATYKFIKGTLNFPAFKVNVTEEFTATSNKSFVGTFDIEGDWSNSEYELSISKQPKHGTLFVDDVNGEYYYRADRKYEGEDSFVLSYNDQTGKTQEVTVNVVLSDDSSGKSDNDQDISDKADSIKTEIDTFPKKLNKKSWIYGLFGGIAAAVVAFIFIKRKKNKK